MVSLQTRRCYSPSVVALSENSPAVDTKAAAIEYNANKAVYRKRVSQLRKEYASEVALQRAVDLAEREAKRKQETRQKLERQRQKNVRSAQNAARQLAFQEQSRREREERLRLSQQKRKERKARFQKARQLLLNELEEEAPLWLTTPEEVEAAFTTETDQLLWARPNSVLGAPAPSDDAEFWKYESHTWHLNKTYPTRKELLLKKLLERTYEESNVDETYWTGERLAERMALEDKAKLRAMVRDEGKKALLLKQKQLLQDGLPDKNSSNMGDIPQPVPVPNVRLLANVEAMEEEGANLLLQNPTQFFEFSHVEDKGGKDSNETPKEYIGPALGAPSGLKDPLRSGNPQHRPYPLVFGHELAEDTRTEREKKRQQREDAMWAAAQEEQGGGMALDEDFDVSDLLNRKGGGVDYSGLKYEEDEKWEEGLDPVADAELLATPREERYTEEDLDWVVERLEKRAGDLEDELEFEIATMRQELQARLETGEGGKSTRTTTATTEEQGPYTIESGGTVHDVSALGVDVNELNELFASLNEEQVLELHAIETKMDKAADTEERRKLLSTIPGLSEKQMDSIIQIEESLLANTAFSNDGNHGDTSA